jgi:hypothetical protein
VAALFDPCSAATPFKETRRMFPQPNQAEQVASAIESAFDRNKIGEQKIEADEEGRFVTYNDIVPDKEQHALLYWRDQFSIGYFEVGDIANELVKRAVREKIGVSRTQVFQAVGAFVGKARNTISYYASTAAFFPPDVRNEFHMLSFSHFVFARMEGERWREVLEWAALRPHCTENDLFVEFRARGIERAVGLAGLAEHESSDSSAVERTTSDAKQFSLEYLRSKSLQSLTEACEAIDAAIETCELSPLSVARLNEAKLNIGLALPELAE